MTILGLFLRPTLVRLTPPASDNPAFGSVDQALSAPAFIIFDATLSEVHSARSRISDFPIENGSDISDNVQKLPRRYSMEGMVTNNPVGIFAPFSSGVGSVTELFGGVSRKQNAFDQVFRIWDLKQKVDIVTGMTIYRDMLIDSVDAPRDRNTGDSTRFRINFKQITTVETRVLLPGQIAGIPDAALPVLSLGLVPAPSPAAAIAAAAIGVIAGIAAADQAG